MLKTMVYEISVSLISAIENLLEQESFQEKLDQLIETLADGPIKTFYSAVHGYQTLRNQYYRKDEKSSIQQQIDKAFPAIQKTIEDLITQTEPAQNTFILYFQAFYYAHFHFDEDGNICLKSSDNLPYLQKAKLILKELCERNFTPAYYLSAQLVIEEPELSIYYHNVGAKLGYLPCMAELGQQYLRFIRNQLLGGPNVYQCPEGLDETHLLNGLENAAMYGNLNAISYIHTFAEDDISNICQNFNSVDDWPLLVKKAVAIAACICPGLPAIPDEAKPIIKEWLNRNTGKVSLLREGIDIEYLYFLD